MAYQIYRIGEWERVGGVDGYSTIRAYLQPGLYETGAYARKKAARLADQDYENGGDGSFQASLRSAKAHSTTTDRRSPPGGPPIRTSSISTTAPFEETAMTRKTEDVPRLPAPPVERTHTKRRDVDTRPRPATAKSPRIAASSRTKPA